MAPKNGITLAEVNTPLYAIRMLGDRHVLVAGGGGQAKTGVQNLVEVFELKKTDEGCVSNSVCRHDTGSMAIMNLSVMTEGQSKYVIAAGMDEKCQLYMMRQRVVDPSPESETKVRRRKGHLTDARDNQSAQQMSTTFSLDSIGDTQTDFHEDGGFQKNVVFSPSKEFLLTGGADGFIRAWKFPSLEMMYEVEAHSNEIDDMDISPSGSKVVSVGKDGCAYLWNTKDGSKHLKLEWTQKTNIKYRYRACRFGLVEGQKDKWDLYTVNIPVTRGRTGCPCYLTRWDCSTYTPKSVQSTGEDVISAFTVSDNGIYLGTGTLTGDVSIYISFSLQKLHHVKGAHSYFISGLQFTPSTNSSKVVTGADKEFTLLSISVDNKVKMHQLRKRGEISVLWVILAAVALIYIIISCLAYYGFEI